MQQIASIAIIGGGFSGICTAMHLIAKANKPLTIYLIEKEADLCKGVAYGTSSPYHPLNVRAGRMGLFADHPEHFYAWLESHPDIWRNSDPVFHSLNITPDSFLPRKLYAVYLQNVFIEMQAFAAQKEIICHIISDCASDAILCDEKIEVKLNKHSPLFVDYMVLATGVFPNQRLPFETPALLNHTSYIANIWASGVERLLHNDFAGSKGIRKKIIIIGSGLTAVDVLFTLHSFHYQGGFHFISKHGTFPEAHKEHLLPLLPDFKVTNIPTQLSDLILFFKQQLDLNEHLDWRQLLDAFRHCTQAMWQSFSFSTRKQFMRHLFFLWNKHRHRMSPQSHELVRCYEMSQALTLASGIIQEIIPLLNGKLQVKYIDKKTDKLVIEEANCVINCAGPNYQIKYHPDPLIQQLLQKQMVIPDDMGLGLKLNQNRKLAGTAEGKIFALGALLFGELLETTAVPEIRKQANFIAKTILSFN